MPHRTEFAVELQPLAAWLAVIKLNLFAAAGLNPALGEQAYTTKQSCE